MSMEEYIGTRVSIFSNRNARYEGILSGYNVENQIVILKNVTFFGTEDRTVDSPIPGKPDQLYPFVQFKAEHIKQIMVFVEEDNSKEDLYEDPIIANELPEPIKKRKSPKQETHQQQKPHKNKNFRKERNQQNGSIIAEIEDSDYNLDETNKTEMFDALDKNLQANINSIEPVFNRNNFFDAVEPDEAKAKPKRDKTKKRNNNRNRDTKWKSNFS
eukprot:TRINITY_DN3691_c0_g1_i1.p1 TRINITY_DN3691_c0_g1~~TRINITY_DN3691_c0_g1_i1.p1  ORF type:complete len:215 (+),score=65.26 TRINITY_DN3691_c0_g1_i1:43-687(+)